MDAMTEPVAHRIETAQLRRSPRYGVFLLAGAVLGVIVAGVLTLLFGDEQLSAYTNVRYSSGQVFGFLALVGVAVGLALGGIVALVLDRVVGRRTREVTISHDRVVDPSTGSGTD